MSHTMSGSNPLGHVTKRSVLVKIEGTDQRKQKVEGRESYISMNGVSSLGASGIIWDEASGAVITTATLLSPFLKDPSNIHSPELLPETHLYVMKEEDKWRAARLVKIISCSGVKEALGGLTDHFYSEWEVGWARKPASPQAKDLWANLNCIAVIAIEDKSDLMYKSWSFPTLSLSFGKFNRGDPIYSIGSPHGIQLPKTFLNYTFKGIISNVVSVDGDPKLYMMDCECLPGCEGGSVYNPNGQLMGLILPPIRLRGSPNIQILLFLPITTFISDLKALFPKMKPFLTSADNLNQHRSVIETCLSSLVLITVGSSWASGIVLSRTGYILTSGHLIKPYLADQTTLLYPQFKSQSTQINVRLNNDLDHWYPASVVFSKQNYVDIALLKLSNPVPPLVPVRLGKQEVVNKVSGGRVTGGSAFNLGLPVEGQEVLVIGYGLFAPRYRLPAMICKGIVSKIVYEGGQPIVIESDARVNKGASGGMLVDANTGDYLGQITSNTKQEDGTEYQKLNCSIPASSLEPVFQFVQGKRDALEAYLEQSPQRDNIWALKIQTEEQHSHQIPSQFLSFLHKFQPEKPQTPPLPLQSKL